MKSAAQKLMSGGVLPEQAIVGQDPTSASDGPDAAAADDEYLQQAWPNLLDVELDVIEWNRLSPTAARVKDLWQWPNATT